MKKIFTLLVLVMATVCAMAQTNYKGKFSISNGSFPDSDCNLTYTQADNGAITLVFDHVVFGDADFGKLTFSNIYDEWTTSAVVAQEGGNTTISANAYIQFYGINVDPAEKTIQIKWYHFEAGGTDYRIVSYTGTETTGGGNEDGPSVVSTESFNSNVTSRLNYETAERNNLDGVQALVQEWSDGSFSLQLSDVATDWGNFGKVTFKGLQKTEEGAQIKYTGTVVPSFESMPSFLTQRDLSATVDAVIDEDGNLTAAIVLTDNNGLTIYVDYNYVEPFTPRNPISASGTLAGYTNTADGEFSNSAASTITFTETARDVYTVTLSGVALPSASIDLGTVTLEGVDCKAGSGERSYVFTKKGGTAATTSEHPVYTEVDVTSFAANLQMLNGGDDADDSVGSLSATLVIDNYDEAVTYTFSLAPVTSVKNITLADGSVQHIYTISGAKVGTLQKGINILRTADGKTVKVLK